MREAKGNIWDLPGDAICILTNGIVKSNGDAVMGKGIALEAAQRFPTLPARLGKYIKEDGNHVFDVVGPCEAGDNAIGSTQWIFSFPTKHHWRDKADPLLIARSCIELMERLNDLGSYNIGFDTVLLPRPGCGAGGLDWQKEVKPIVEANTDDRIVVVSF